MSKDFFIFCLGVLLVNTLLSLILALSLGYNGYNWVHFCKQGVYWAKNKEPGCERLK